MGNCNLKSAESDESTGIFIKISIKAISITNFSLVHVIGRGGFGKV